MGYSESLRQHLEAQWGPPLRAIDWAEGRRGELPVDFRVWVFRRPSDGVLAYSTVGMSEESDPDAIELFLLVRAHDDDRRLAELLFAIAHFHRTGSHLGLWHTVNFGRPWLDASACTHGLISLPYLDGEALEHPAVVRTRVLWLIPVTQTEVDFRRRYGTDALEARFEEKRFDYLDPHRLAVVDDET